MDDDAKFPRFLNHGLLGDYPATPDYWHSRMARDEHWFPFSPDAVGIFYPLATFDSRDSRIDGDGDFGGCVNRGGIGFVGGAEIV